jgi:hypothetical protein
MSSRTPGDTRTPGWIPLMYTNIETSDSVNCGEFLDYLSVWEFLKESCAPQSSSVG